MNYQKAIAFVKTPVFVAKEYLHRRADPKYRCDFVRGEEIARVLPIVQSLEQDGIVILPRYFSSTNVDKFRSAFERAVSERPGKYTPDSFYNDDILQVDPAFFNAALDDFVLQTIGMYFQRRFGLAIAAATRLLPTPPVRQSSYRWHHDARGRQINLMLLLSDVTSSGQRMSYLCGTHRRYYNYYRGIAQPMFDQDVFSGESYRNSRIVEVIGSAGTVALFDSNGLHSGNRNDVEKRDTLNINFVSARRHFKPISCRRVDLDALPKRKREVVTFNSRLTILG